jgi:hypothetical protein
MNLPLLDFDSVQVELDSTIIGVSVFRIYLGNNIEGQHERGCNTNLAIFPAFPAFPAFE